MNAEGSQIRYNEMYSCEKRVFEVPYGKYSKYFERLTYVHFCDPSQSKSKELRFYKSLGKFSSQVEDIKMKAVSTTQDLGMLMGKPKNN